MEIQTIYQRLYFWVFKEYVLAGGLKIYVIYLPACADLANAFFLYTTFLLGRGRGRFFTIISSSLRF